MSVGRRHMEAPHVFRDGCAEAGLSVASQFPGEFAGA
jgi:hypothetical protein